MSFNIRKYTFSNLAVMVVILGAVACVCAQDLNNFSSLEKHAGNEVSVETSEGQRVTGKLVRVEQNRIVVYRAATPVPIPRESVKRVTRYKNRHTAAWIAGMTAAGLGAGFLIGLRGFDDALQANGKIAAASLAGAGAGAAAGFAISRIGKQEQVIYESSGNGTGQN